jgi:phosphatidylserine/phosphatidylglycerophosphate/cardiolipin synthase-like enzyme
MAEFLTTNEIASSLEQIIEGSQKKIVLISPYLQLPQILFERLQDADRKKVQIIVVYGKDELKPEERAKLNRLSNLSLHYYKNLHAKCYFNEESMIIASMNLIEFSEKRNRELGVLIRKSTDEKLFGEARCEADSIVYFSTREPLVQQKEQSRQTTREKGHCIRCNAPIPPDRDKPYCPGCFSTWIRYANPEYKEKHCHLCGKPAVVSMARPLCRSCYLEHQNDDWAQPIVDTFRRLFGL